MSQRMRAASGASSSSHARTVLPLIDCLQCFIPIIRLVSRQPKTYGQNRLHTCKPLQKNITEHHMPNHDLRLRTTLAGGAAAALRSFFF
ncbi:hypothetical protein EJB05_04969, partial [Eragrostis curvula]